MTQTKLMLFIRIPTKIHIGFIYDKCVYLVRHGVFNTDERERDPVVK